LVSFGRGKYRAYSCTKTQKPENICREAANCGKEVNWDLPPKQGNPAIHCCDQQLIITYRKQIIDETIGCYVLP
jgi:hypothetical protein